MKLPVMSGKEMVRVLSKIGFVIAGRKGSHVILEKETDDTKKKTVVPQHDELAPGTLLSILKQAGLTRDDLQDLMGK